jgi:hypothetical protein
MEEVSDISCGNILPGPADVLVATAPMLNRFNLYSLPTATQPAIPSAAYAEGTGPQSIVAMDIGGTGNTAEDDLFAVSIMNGSSPFRGTAVRSDGTTLSTLGSPTAIGSAWKHLNQVEYATGREALGILDGMSSGVFRLYDLSAGGLSHIASKSISIPNSPAYVSFIPAGDSLAQFLVWEPGEDVVKAFAMTEPSPGSYGFSSTTSYSLGSPIDSIQLIQGRGRTTLLAVTFKGGQAMEIYDYNGTGAPVPLQDIFAPTGELLIGVLPIGTDDFALFTPVSGNFSGAVTVDQQHFSGGQFSSVGSTQLSAPSIGNSANVMTFEGEPLVVNTPRRLQLLHGGDWANKARISVGQIQAIAETDAGVLNGLGNPHSVALGAANPAAAYTLVNQLHPAIAVFSFDAARGEEVAILQISPDPGTYGTSIEVSLSATPASTLYYRTNPSSSWTLYSGSFTLFSDTDVQYYALRGSKQSIIRTAAYRFSDSPSDLDSDGDGIPDYVELANGLDPLTSGLDSDGDGFSDLEELLAGTNPLDDSDMPANRLEQGTLYDLALSPFVYDGVSNIIRRCSTHTQVRLFSASGGLRSYAKTRIMSLDGRGTIAARFNGVSRSAEPPFLTAVTDSRYDLYGVAAGNQRGVEMVGVYAQPESTSVQVPYLYQGGALTTEANNWIASAQTTYSNQVREVVSDTLEMNDVLSGLLIERKLADLLFSRGMTTNTTISLFKGRLADKTLPGFRVAELQSLETAGAGGEAAYHLPTLISTLQARTSSMLNMRRLVKNVYDTCSDYGRLPENAGKYPLPVDVLRTFIETGVLHSNYLAKSTQSSAQRDAARTEIANALAVVPARTQGTFVLSVQSDSFDAACPVLYTGGNVAKSLYSANGNPFRFPITFTLQPGAKVTVTAYTDVTWNQCPSTDPLEVISLTLTAVPTASGSDANGNLIPDDYEALFLAESGGTATSDLDGDGFSDLQEYLDGTDPASNGSHGLAPVDFSAPILTLDASDLSIGWPAAYASEFVFTVEYTEDLPGSPFAAEQELPRGDLNTVLDQSANHRFYRVKMQLR